MQIDRACFLLIFICIGSIQLPAQTKLNWETLGEVEFEYEYNEELNQWLGKPNFGEVIQELNGQEVEIKGYVLPIDVEGEYYALSAFPYVSCFFCGGAGPESIMELKLKNPKDRFEMDDYLSFKGKLQLNDKDFEMTYVLNEAEVINLK